MKEMKLFADTPKPPYYAVIFTFMTARMDEMHSLPVDDLDEFYDTALDAIDNIKLFKKTESDQRERYSL